MLMKNEHDKLLLSDLRNEKKVNLYYLEHFIFTIEGKYMKENTI